MSERERERGKKKKDDRIMKVICLKKDPKITKKIRNNC